MPRIDQLNLLSEELCQSALNNADELDIKLIEMPGGGKVLDFGSERRGTQAAGIELSKICLGASAEVEIVPSPNLEFDRSFVRVETNYPLDACIASQYAGWPFSTENMFAMCSGPCRILRGREEILDKFGLTSKNNSHAVGIWETNQIPAEVDFAEFSSECKSEVANVTICIARTKSLPGMLQVVARSVETAMHKLFELEFDLRKVKRGIGLAPIPPFAEDDYVAMGWTNDSILYGASVELWFDDLTGFDLKKLAASLPSSSSHEFGRPFQQIFEEYNRDFYKVDRMLFSPAKIQIHCLASGQSATAGELRFDLLESSFGTTTS